MYVLIWFLKLATFALVLALPVRAAPAEASSCFDDWSDAAPVMLQEGLLGTKELHALARQRLPGDLVRITLCQEGGRYIYRLLMRDARGRLNTVTVDARKPFDH
jgi:uncharacterized membrane protein YkoI